jgi:hypothetical protein
MPRTLVDSRHAVYHRDPPFHSNACATRKKSLEKSILFRCRDSIHTPNHTTRNKKAPLSKNEAFYLSILRERAAAA